MSAFFTIDWLILYVILFVLFGLPIIAIVRENSDIKLVRSGFAYWVCGFILFQVVGTLIGEVFEHVSEMGIVIYGIAFLIANFVFAYVLAGRFVRRARDAGMGKGIAYLSIIPFVGIVTTLILLFKASAEEFIQD